jgi:hypothetical protein
MATPQIIGDGHLMYPFTGEAFAKAESRDEAFRPMTMTEFNDRIDKALAARQAGDYISQQELEKEILSW